MIESPIVCSLVLQHLQNWADRENFAFTCHSIRNLCLFETLCIPPYIIYVNDPKPITTIPRSIVRILTLAFSDNARSEAILLPREINRLVKSFIKLVKLVVEVQFSRRAVKKLAESLIIHHPYIDLYVPVSDINFYHEKLYRIYSDRHNITLATTTVIYNEYNSSSSSSEEENQIHCKRKYSMYQTTDEVKKSMESLREILMKPYVESGQAKLKKHCSTRSSFQPLQFQSLIAQNLISHNSTYQPIENISFPKFDCTYIFQNPINIELVTSQVISVANNFIESIICFDNMSVLITQIDAFIRNNKLLDPCAIDTHTTVYPGTPTANILQKSFKRITWYELVIMYERVELLVTGGVYGYTNGGDLRSFLGANLKVTKPISTEAPANIYLIRPSLSNVFREERLLQNYSRSAANYKWGFRSVRFSAKGFKTANPLYIGNNPMEQAASLILWCIANNRFNIEDQEKIVSNIHEAAAGYSIDIFRINDDLRYLQMLLPSCNMKLRITVRATVELINGLSLSHLPQSIIDGTMATSLYNNVIRYRCSITNSNIVLNEAFLK